MLRFVISAADVVVAFVVAYTTNFFRSMKKKKEFETNNSSNVAEAPHTSASHAACGDGGRSFGGILLLVLVPLHTRADIGGQIKVRGWGLFFSKKLHLILNPRPRCLRSLMCRRLLALARMDATQQQQQQQQKQQQQENQAHVMQRGREAAAPNKGRKRKAYNLKGRSNFFSPPNPKKQELKKERISVFPNLHLDKSRRGGGGEKKCTWSYICTRKGNTA